MRSEVHSPLPILSPKPPTWYALASTPARRAWESMRAEIVSVGTELLLGHIVATNEIGSTQPSSDLVAHAADVVCPGQHPSTTSEGINAGRDCLRRDRATPRTHSRY